MDILRWLLGIFRKAFWPSLESTFGLNPTTAACAFFSLLWFLYIKKKAEGSGAMKLHWSDTIKVLAAGLLAWVPFYLATAIFTAYEDYQSVVAENRRLVSTNNDLRNSLTTNLPAQQSTIVSNAPHWSKEVQFQALGYAGSRTWKIEIFSFKETIQPVRLRLRMNRSVEIEDVLLEAGAQEVEGKRWKLLDGNKTLEIRFDGPAINIMNQLNVQIKTKDDLPPKSLKVLFVEKWVE